MTRADHIAIIVRDPLWLPHRYDPQHDAVHFLKVDRAITGRASFLTDQELPSGLPSIVLGRAESIAAAPPPAPLRFIFHSGYCCSTLLARAFDRPRLATVLKEPTILNDLVGWHRRGEDRDRMQSVSIDILRLLARPFESEEVVVIKPSNVLNALATSLLDQQRDARALLLHAPLTTYLGSIARKGMWGALWVREHLIGALDDGIVNLGFDREALLRQTDMQIAAIGWLVQHALFQQLARRFGPDRIRTIDSERLLAQRVPSLVGLGMLFDVPLNEATAQEIAGSAVFSRHSKFATPFGTAERRREQDMLPADRRDEIEKVAVWIEAVARNIGLSLELDAPLLG